MGIVVPISQKRKLRLQLGKCSPKGQGWDSTEDWRAPKPGGYSLHRAVCSASLQHHSYCRCLLPVTGAGQGHCCHVLFLIILCARQNMRLPALESQSASFWELAAPLSLPPRHLSTRADHTGQVSGSQGLTSPPGTQKQGPPWRALGSHLNSLCFIFFSIKWVLKGDHRNCQG